MIKYTPIPLNEGFDTITPPVMKEGGSLIDCLNYEMTGEFGYRRIDGYERYDGWVGGEIANYYRVNVQIVDASVVAELVPGANLYVNDPAGAIVMATVVAYTNTGGNTGQLVYASVNPDYLLLRNGRQIDTDDSPTWRINVTSDAVSGIVTDPPATFVANLRTYQAALRGTIVASPTSVVGIHFFRDQPIVALNCPVISVLIFDPAQRALLNEGGIVGYQGTRYRIVTKTYFSTSGLVTLTVDPIGGVFPFDSNLRLINSSGGTYGTVVVDGPISVTYDSSDDAYLVAYGTPDQGGAHAPRTLERSVWIRFANGVAAMQSSFAVGQTISIGLDGSTYQVGYITSAVLQSGTFAANTAAGWLEVSFSYTLNPGGFGNKPWVDTTSDVLSPGGSKWADIAETFVSKIAGEKMLRATRTRYQWITANFYGQEETLRAYGATGASRAFWANAYIPTRTVPTPTGAISTDQAILYAWGNIRSAEFLYQDKPKYLAFHANSQLALGFEGGSVILSVPGEPYNYEGVQGASEVATGDQLTGLLEAQDDSLIVFGKRTIRRVTGSTDADLAVRTISGNSGCLDYTAVLVGGLPMFASPNGITSLEQAETYGDFEGQRATYKISNTLPLKLTPDRSDSETGGAAMALPVRSKNQYRLWLKSGEVIVVTITSEGPKVTRSDYGADFTTNSVRVPFAWSSQLSDSSKEYLLVAWDSVLALRYQNVNGSISSTIPDQKRMYALDRGWGFDGARFPSNFDVAHVFQDVGTHLTTIKKVRIHGLSYGLATINLKAAGVIRPDFFDQAYHTRVQDISLPRSLTLFSAEARPVTSIVDTAIEGLGIKLGFYATQLTPTETEPSHTIQVLVCEADEGGQQDG